MPSPRSAVVPQRFKIEAEALTDTEDDDLSGRGEDTCSSVEDSKDMEWSQKEAVDDDASDEFEDEEMPPKKKTSNKKSTVKQEVKQEPKQEVKTEKSQLLDELDTFTASNPTSKTSSTETRGKATSRGRGRGRGRATGTSNGPRKSNNPSVADWGQEQTAELVQLFAIILLENRKRMYAHPPLARWKGNGGSAINQQAKKTIKKALTPFGLKELPECGTVSKGKKEAD
ncbi:unnamed protein product [Sympodiomycopsis kandeliae]